MAKTMTFEYSGAPQRSPEWLEIRRGKIGASRLCDWLAVSKAKGKEGQPLKPRLDYEKELMFERQFGTSFEKWVSEAMQDGVDLEDFARRQYEQITKLSVDECGCWYNDYFVASPDRVVPLSGKDFGLVEIKLLKDTSFTDVLINGVPEKYWQQIQGQLWASGARWCDFVAVNLNSKKVVIIRVKPDEEFHEYLELAVQEKLVTEEFALTNVHDIIGDVPQGLVFEAAKLSQESNQGGW